MNANVSEELVNNEGLLNWTNSNYVPAFEQLLEQLPIEIQREFERDWWAHVLPIPPSHSRLIVIDLYNFDISIVIEESKEGECEEFDCSICFELSKAESKITLNCGHSFCGQCNKKTLTSCNRRTPTCALCRTNVTSFKVPNKEIHDLVAPYCNNVV